MNEQDYIGKIYNHMRELDEEITFEPVTNGEIRRVQGFLGVVGVDGENIQNIQEVFDNTPMNILGITQQDTPFLEMCLSSPLINQAFELFKHGELNRDQFYVLIIKGLYAESNELRAFQESFI